MAGKKAEAKTELKSKHARVDEPKHASPDSKTKGNRTKGSRSIDRRELIRKCILLALLLAFVVFLVIERDYLKDRITNNFFPKGTEPTIQLSMLGDHVAEQPFIAESGSIGSIGIEFYNEARTSATGTLTVELLDSVGEVVSSTDIEASLVKQNTFTRFLLGGSSEILNSNHTVEVHGKNQRSSRIYLDKGKTYTFRVTGRDIASEGAFDILLYSTSPDASAEADTALSASFDGAQQDGARLYMYTKNDVYSKKTIALFVILIAMTAIFVLIPFRRIDAAISGRRESSGAVSASGRSASSASAGTAGSHRSRQLRPAASEAPFSSWISRIMFIMAPAVAYFIDQKYVEYGLAKFIRHILSDPAKPILNLIIIGFIWWLIYTIFNSTRITSALTVIFFSAFGFVNYMLLQFRSSPLVYTDIAQIGTALQVADSYTITLTKHFLWAVLLTVLWCVASMAPPAHRGLPLKKRIIPVAVLAVWFGVLYYSIFVSSVIEDHNLKVSSFRPTDSYYRNGCPLAFMITWKTSIVQKPEGYDPANIQALAEKYPSDEALTGTKVSAETPNIIIVMNESFSDLSVTGEFETNKDFLPIYRSIQDNAVKGWMYSSVFGGSTANSEFECLTGFTVRFLPFHSVAFRSLITEETPSLASYMTANGYGGNIAFHPGLYNSYNRNVVYPLLGFDKHISKEDLEDPEMIRDFVSDSQDYAIVESEYEKFRAGNADSPFWMFNVTIQNHGGYSYNTGTVDAGISMQAGDTEYELAGQFLNLMKLSDEALGELIEYYSNTDEETVIVLFGDHQPRVDEEFYNAMRSQHEGISDLEWSELQHMVPFMIWANYDIDGNDGDATAAAEADAENAEAAAADGDFIISANYIAAYLKNLIGMPMTGFDKYLLDLRETLPVICDVCYKDAEGKVYDPDDAAAFDEIINEYNQIEYNGLIDYKNRVDSFFNLK